LLTNDPLIDVSTDEAGFDVLMGAEEAIINSALYTEKAFVLARGFVTHVLMHPIQGLEDVIRSLYFPDQDGGSNLLQEVIQQCKDIVCRTEDKQAVHDISVTPNDRGVMRLSAGALILLKRNLAALEEVMARLKSPVPGGATK
jgi:ubiquitin-conjugating enzyme E2 O